MLVDIPDVLTTAELAEVRRIIDAADLVEGRETAGELAAQAKRNLQLPQEGQAARDAGEIISRALGRNALFNSVALPFRVLRPLFNRYEVGMAFDAHVDGAVRAMPWGGPRMRADVSSTLFVTDPDDYDGGELLIEHAYGTSSVKLPAGSMIVYPAGASTGSSRSHAARGPQLSSGLSRCSKTMGCARCSTIWTWPSSRCASS